MLVALTVQNEVVSILLVGACILAAVVVLYRNLALLTSITTEDMKLGVLRTTTLFNVGVLMVGILFAVLTASGLVTVSKDGEKLLAISLSNRKNTSEAIKRSGQSVHVPLLFQQFSLPL